MHTNWPILYEDNHLLVVIKPAMLPTMGVPAGKTSLLVEAKDYIRQKYQKPGNVYLGIVSRLDTPVSGALVLARTSKAAARLTEQFRIRSVRKTYLAAVAGPVEPPAGSLTHYLRKDERHRKVHTSIATAAGAQEARLHYRTIQPCGEATVLKVELETGRKHQIRVQLSAAGHPILGDRKYGSSHPFARGIALHAHQLEFDHPVSKERLTFTAGLPESWKRFAIR
ncbi:MAG: RluA family pseudouridine synthase [Planctomycetales bacterium]|nr:RluA family pseudouridine synthase [Planctomycetales bacterium]